MLDWQRKLICTLWVRWRGAQVVFHAADYFGRYLLLYVFALNSPVSPAHLQAAVVLNPRYPEVSPLFSLSLSWKGERSGQTDDNLRVRLLQCCLLYTCSIAEWWALYSWQVSPPFTRLWRAKWTCSKANYRVRIRVTSSWPTRFHVSVFVWMCTWRLKGKMMASRGRESSRGRRCVYALWGTFKRRLFDTMSR